MHVRYGKKANFRYIRRRLCDVSTAATEGLKFCLRQKRNAVSGFLCTSALLRCKLENLKGPFLGSGGLSFYFFFGGGHPPPPPPQEMVIGGPHLRKKGAWEMYT